MDLLFATASVAAAICACVGALQIVRFVSKSVRYRRQCRVPSEQKRAQELIERLKEKISKLEQSRSLESPLSQQISAARWAGEKELRIAELGLQNQRWSRSLLHAKIGLAWGNWSERLGRCESADDAEGSVTKLLSAGLEHLCAWRLAEAENCFQQICEEPKMDVAAKVISLRAHSWILDFWNQPYQAEDEVRQAAELALLVV